MWSHPAAKGLGKLAVAGPSWIQLKILLESSSLYLSSREEKLTWWWRTAEPRNCQRNEARKTLRETYIWTFQLHGLLLFFFMLKTSLTWGFCYLQPRAICFSNYIVFPQPKSGNTGFYKFPCTAGIKTGDLKLEPWQKNWGVGDGMVTSFNTNSTCNTGSLLAKTPTIKFFKEALNTVD